MSIPLPKLLRRLRVQQVQRRLQSVTSQLSLRLWALLAARPGAWRFATGCITRVLSWLGGTKRRLRWLPVASAWTKTRDFPAPEGATFQQRWKQRQK